MRKRFFHKILFVLLVTSVLFLLWGCPTTNPPTSTNNPPSKPNLVSPENNATGVSVTPTLSWTCSDPDEDNLVYDVYLDKNSNPQTSIVSNHSSTTYTLTTALEYNTTYYWKVVAKDGKGGTSTSDVYSFTTVNVTGSLSIYKKYQLALISASGPVYSSPAMGPDGKIYIGSQGKYLVILPNTYSIVDTAPASPVWASPVVDYANNKVYFADNRGYLHVYYPDKLSYKISNYSIYAAPVIIGDYVYVVDLAGRVIKVSKSNPSNYTIIRNLNKEVRSSPVVVDGKLFVATVDGYIYAIDPSGNIVWQKGFSDEFLGGFAVDLNKNLYIAGEKLWCINSTNGNVIWSYDLSGQVYGSPVISENGTVYVGDISGTLYAIDSSNGQLIWKKSDLDWILSSCIIGDNNVIYVAAGTFMFALRPSDGQILSYVELESFVESSPLLHFGKLFVADEAGYFYVINALSDSIQDPDLSWPMFQRNWYHTAER